MRTLSYSEAPCAGQAARLGLWRDSTIPRGQEGEAMASAREKATDGLLRAPAQVPCHAQPLAHNVLLDLSKRHGLLTVFPYRGDTSRDSTTCAFFDAHSARL